MGYITIVEFGEKYCDNPNKQNEDCGGFSVDEVNNSYIYIDDFKNHKKIIDDFKLKNDKSLEMFMITVSKRFSDISFVNSLKKREKIALELYDIEKYLRLCILCHPKKNELETGVKSIYKIGTFTFGDLYYCCYNRPPRKLI